MVNTADYKHKMAAHCETGTVTGILNHEGMDITEPLVFGIAGGIFFAYLESPKLPFPMFVTRSKPGSIRKKIAKRLDASFRASKHRDFAKAQQTLDALINRKLPVAIQVDMFYMDYIPAYMKAHFNGHYITVVGKENRSYTVSDCYYPNLALLSEGSLRKAWFARGDLAPHGLKYHAERVPKEVDLQKAIIGGIHEACRNMLKLPIPFLGVKGIRLFAKKIMDWPRLVRDEQHLSHEIMMISAILEERGTGGAGFRFMYATFLQQAARIINNSELARLSTQMMAIGDRWRELSLHAARSGKKNNLDTPHLNKLREIILARADDEEKFFNQLLKTVK
jgi:hypothetical protein